MTKKEVSAHPGWKICAFESVEMSPLPLGLKAAVRENPEWFEEAEAITLRLGAGREGVRKEHNIAEK